MKKFNILLLTVCLAFNAYSQKDNSGNIEEQIRLVENGLSGQIKIEGKNFNILERMAYYKVKGLSIAVIKDYKIIWAKGYGWANETDKKPVTEKTVFQAASISKSVNSFGVMKLVQDKKLDLNKDINEYLTSWKFPYDSVSKNKKITTYHLLTHTAGLSNGAAMYVRGDTVPTAIETLKGAKASKFIWGDFAPVHSVKEPGLSPEYSNPGIGVTQVIVSDITKLPYEQYMSEAVLKPLGMQNSFYTSELLRGPKAALATGHNDNDWENEIPGQNVIIPTQSAGGLCTTPSDLARFVCEMQLAYQGKSKLLSKGIVQQMFTPVVEMGLAAGFFIVEKKKGGQKYFNHGGSLPGFKCEYWGSFEGGDGVVIMINSGGNAGRIIQEVANSVATVYKWKDFYDDPMIKKSVTVPDSILDKYVGIYSAGPNRFSGIIKKQDGYYQFADGILSKMYFSGPADYFNIDFASEKHFILDSSGHVKGYERIANGTKMFIRRMPCADSLTGPAGQISDFGWQVLMNKEYSQALALFKRDKELDKTGNLMPYCNMAHCYLFMNEYDKAMKLYKEHFDKQMDSRKFKDVVADDFAVFKKSGFDKTLIDKAAAELKIEVPEG